MTRIRIAAAAVIVAALGVGVGAQDGARQGRQGRAGALAGEAAGVTPAEIQRMFDAYALMQAQEQLQIGDANFAPFLTRYKALLDIRRRTLQERTRIINEMRRMLNSGQADEGQLRDHIKALQEVDSRASADERKAYDAIDQVLDVRQQAKFRVFEELMERRKLELVARARQAGRGNKPQ